MIRQLDDGSIEAYFDKNGVVIYPREVETYGGVVETMSPVKKPLPAEEIYIKAGGKDQNQNTGTPPNPDGLDIPDQVFGIPTGWLLLGGAAVLGLWLLSDDKK
jgi:hypothetical protein